MSLQGYTVLCYSDSSINGDYVESSTAKGKYLQQSGNYVLGQHVTGQWGIGDGTTYPFLTKIASNTPSGQLYWQQLIRNKYVDVSIKVDAKAVPASFGKGLLNSNSMPAIVLLTYSPYAVASVTRSVGGGDPNDPPNPAAGTPVPVF
jgi:hypothetical protein